MSCTAAPVEDGIPVTTPEPTATPTPEPTLQEVLSEKIQDLDCVSFGPDMKDIHTSREKLHIASTERVWNLLLELLKAL